MKKMKKLLSLVLTVAMIVAMGITTFAADNGKTTININGGASGSEYAAYKLLNATDGGNGKIAYTLNEKYTSALQAVTGKTKQKDILDYISKLNAAGTRTFADAVYEKVKTLNLTADKTTSNDKFENVDQGYYLIVETKTGNAQDTYSLVMLDTAGKDAVNVNTKESTPELVKKVQEKNDSTGDTSNWQDGADYDIGDDVPFQLTGTVSSRYDNYKTYYYAFHDKMSKGLTFDAGSVEVKVDGNKVDKSKYSIVTNDLEDGCIFEVRINDLKQVGVTVSAKSKITVDYKATLNGEAVIGSQGNPNEAKLEYSNNPYGDGTGKTPEDKVIVFTYKLVANKVDKDGKALKGAGFTLYKYNKSKESYEAVGSEIIGTDEEPKTTFEFERLDAGKYKLVETTVPAGYNKAEDIEFTVEATYDTDKLDPKFGELVIKDKNGNTINDAFTVDSAKGSASTNVVNLSGTKLPSTGGIGTTIFYVIGGILMVGAGVILVSRRRRSK